MGSRARRDGDDYVLSGEKMWITLADIADRFLVFAKTDPERGANGISAFILERGWPGLTTGTIEGKMGVRASNTGWINMADVRVPAGNLDAFRSWVLGLLEHAEVLEPASLRAEIVAWLSAVGGEA